MPLFGYPAPMKPILLTAGATRNRVDAIRYLSAFASGGTALSLVDALGDGPVHLLGSAEALLRARLAVAERRLAGLPDWKLELEEYGGTRDLQDRMRRWLQAHPRGVVVHSAAVGDYEAAPNPSKIPSGQAEILIRLTPAPKILDQLRGWAPDCRIVSFKAGAPGLSPSQLTDIARAQLRRTTSDLV
ncbi:MAG TPA: phosphopantothenoylcysteine decarboxylase, partial [Myxococcota bacterium]|nr:phosphopantothenoylcysteine decarboxylase [Myxococcota bacterium]